MRYNLTEKESMVLGDLLLKCGLGSLNKVISIQPREGPEGFLLSCDGNRLFYLSKPFLKMKPFGSCICLHLENLLNHSKSEIW